MNLESIFRDNPDAKFQIEVSCIYDDGLRILTTPVGGSYPYLHSYILKDNRLFTHAEWQEYNAPPPQVDDAVFTELSDEPPFITDLPQTDCECPECSVLSEAFASENALGAAGDVTEDLNDLTLREALHVLKDEQSEIYNTTTSWLYGLVYELAFDPIQLLDLNYGDFKLLADGLYHVQKDEGMYDDE